MSIVFEDWVASLKSEGVLSGGFSGGLLDESVDVDKVVVSGDSAESYRFSSFGVSSSNVISVEINSSTVFI